MPVEQGRGAKECRGHGGYLCPGGPTAPQAVTRTWPRWDGVGASLWTEHAWRLWIGGCREFTRTWKEDTDLESELICSNRVINTRLKVLVTWLSLTCCCSSKIVERLDFVGLMLTQYNSTTDFKHLSYVTFSLFFLGSEKKKCWFYKKDTI